MVLIIRTWLLRTVFRNFVRTLVLELPELVGTMYCTMLLFVVFLSLQVKLRNLTCDERDCFFQDGKKLEMHRKRNCETASNLLVISCA